MKSGDLYNLFPKTRLSDLGLDFPFLIAPMVGISHVAFRMLIRSYLPEGLDAAIFTEMLSTRRLPTEKLQVANELRTDVDEKTLVPQILGNDETFIAKSLQKLDGLSPWGYDINMGCPVQHTLRHNWGVRLMGDRKYAGEVVRMARAHTDRPLSVKMRGGAGDIVDEDFLLGFTDEIEAAGADWITIHARARKQKHTGRADWPLVGRVRQARSIPVVANGDIQTAQDAISVVDEGMADGAMIARAATARPWILWQIAHHYGYGKAPAGYHPDELPMDSLAEGREYLRAVIRLIDLLDECFDNEDYKLKKLRFFVAQGSRWFTWGHAFWKSCQKGETVREIRDKIERYAVDREFPMDLRINI